MQLPEAFVKGCIATWGEEEAARLCRALDEEPPTSIRLHPRSEASPTWCDVLGVERRVAWSERGYYLTRRPSFTLDPAFHSGAYYVQEASSQFVERLLPDTIEGARLLDLCAAPGGKTTLYASKVGASGLVLANEIDRKRARVLVDNVRKWGLGNVAVSCTDAAHVAALGAWFDVVAVDAPCSGEGMFRKDDGARSEWSEQHVHLCAARQIEILRDAWQSLRGGGTLIYSTCTFNRKEDEEVLARFAEEAGDALIEAPEVAVPAEWGIVCGRVGAFQTFRFFPHRAVGEGFFAAVARKAADKGRRAALGKSRRSVLEPLDRGAQRELERWVEQPAQMRFALAGDTCYGWYADHYGEVKQLSEHLPVIYSGVAMGQLFKGKLKPDQALAHFVGLNREVVPRAELTREEALRYLRRQELTAEGFAEGLNVVTHEGRPLGFAKRIDRRINNLYPNALRILMTE